MDECFRDLFQYLIEKNLILMDYFIINYFYKYLKYIPIQPPYQWMAVIHRMSFANGH